MSIKKCRDCINKNNELTVNSDQPKITVVIPTNRANCVNYLLQNSIYLYKGKLFSFEIHDSSLDEEIKSEIQSFITNNPDFPIRYFHYSSEISADKKAILAINRVKTKYFWLYGDGNLTDFNKIDRILCQNQFWDYNVVNLEILSRRAHLNNDVGLKSEMIYSITSPTEYIVKYFSHLTYWGAALLKTDFFQRAYYNGLVNKYVKDSIPWWIACIIFDLIAYDSKCGVTGKMGVLYSSALMLNPMKKDHWWTHDKRYYEYTFVLFDKGIAKLSDLYPNSVKKRVIINFRKDALVSYSYLMYLRSIGNLNLKLINEYKSEISHITYFYYLMFLYCLIPVSLAKFIIYIKPLIKKALCRGV